MDWVKGGTKLVSTDLSLGIRHGMLRMPVGEASGRTNPARTLETSPLNDGDDRQKILISVAL